MIRGRRAQRRAVQSRCRGHPPDAPDRRQRPATLTNSKDIAGLVSGSPALTPGFANGSANNQTSAIVAARPTFNLLSPGSLYIGTGANVRFGIDRATGQTRNSSCAWGVLSDARLKNSLRDIACPLDTCL